MEKEEVEVVVVEEAEAVESEAASRPPSPNRKRAKWSLHPSGPISSGKMSKIHPFGS